jgi:hypothetical protein
LGGVDLQKWSSDSLIWGGGTIKQRWKQHARYNNEDEEIISVCSEIHAKHINAEFLYVKAGGRL